MGPGEVAVLKTWSLDGTQIAILGGITTINDDRFDVNKSEVATLMIKNVSELGDATIQCAVQTNLGIWKYNIRLEITGENCVSDTSDGSF